MSTVLEEFWRAYLYSSNGEPSGLAVTLWLLAVSLALGFFISLFFAIGHNSKRWYIQLPIRCFSYIFRGTPLYVQILFIYSFYSIGFVKDTPSLSSFFQSGFNCMIMALVLNNVAYTTEIFSGAIRNTPVGDIEAARAYGMSKTQMYVRIILPSALRRALPAYSNEVILMLHATSLAFTVTVPDILKVARDANSATYETFASYGIAALIYLVVSFSLVGLFRLLEKRLLTPLATTH